MKKFTAFVLGLLSALPMTCAMAQAEQAGTDLQKVEISGHKLPPPMRFDVTHVCPGVAQALQDRLGYTAYREDVTALVRVQFRLTGNKIEEVESGRGLSAYRIAARRAVRSLDCVEAGSSEPQTFSFLISFNAPSTETEGKSVVALIER